MIIRSSHLEAELPEGTSVQDCLKALNAFPVGTLAALRGGLALSCVPPPAPPEPLMAGFPALAGV